MSSHPSQKRAIDAALFWGSPAHVFGPKDGREGLLPTERTCDRPDGGELVVFHERVVLVLDDARWTCLSCGASSPSRNPERPLPPRLDS